jgi:hypothetical protein
MEPQTNSQSMTGRTTSFDARTTSFSANPVVAAVARIRALQDDLTPRQREIRDADNRRVDAMLATGAFSLAPRR